MIPVGERLATRLMRPAPRFAISSVAESPDEGGGVAIGKLKQLPAPFDPIDALHRRG
jgi:hypothetical protein